MDNDNSFHQIEKVYSFSSAASDWLKKMKSYWAYTGIIKTSLFIQSTFSVEIYKKKFYSYYSVLANSIIERKKNKIDKMDSIIETYFKASSHQVQLGG